ncbi:hypothetical protein [Flindersiella endophytica]
MIGLTVHPRDLTLVTLGALFGCIVGVGSVISYDALHLSHTRGTAAVRLLPVRSSASQVVFAPYSRVWELAYQAFMIAMIALLWVFPWLADDLAGVGGASGRAALAFFAQFGPYLTVFFVPYLFSYFIRGRHRMGVGLSTEGVYHWSWFGCVFTPWEKLRYVTAVSGRRLGMIKIHLGYDEDDLSAGHVPEENWLAQFSMFRDSRWMNHVGAGHLAIHPALAYWALTFYLEHPERREELGTQAAIDRFRRVDFPYPGRHDPGQLPRFSS